ncbi:uncharacterized protein [Bemisia tabaci]
MAHGMAALKCRIFSSALPVVAALCLVHINVILAEYLDADEKLGRREPDPPTAPTDFWTMATMAANALSPLNILSAQPAQPQTPPLEAVYSNPDFTPLFQELPKLKDELNRLGREEQSNTLFLFKIYIAFPSTVAPFFHQAISQMTSAAPALHDLTKFNIAAELSTYVQSIVDPIPNYFSRIATYMQKLHKRAPQQVPSVTTITGIVSEILSKNIGVPPPLIPLNILQQMLTKLIKTYIEGQLPISHRIPGFPSLQSFSNMVPDVLRNPWKQLKKFKKPRL